MKKPFFMAIMAVLFPLALCTTGAETPATSPDRGEAAIKRGEEIFRSSCQGCHSLKYSGYAARMSAKDAQKAFGDEPPDLNLMTKARGGGSKGAAYIDALLVGFNDTPEKNSVFPNITMPPAFSRNDPELARKAKDVSAFLEYAAEPSERERRGLGGYVLGYMVLLTGLLYALNRRTWKGIRKNPS
jgi:ubiquinol-cytochrome c reductase cytochrome c1 subunit